MIRHTDEILPFYPKNKPVNLIILGTMGSINARSIDEIKPEGDVFFYNNNRNHFWKVIQHLFENVEKPKIFEIPEKKRFLDRHGIAMTNIVDQALVPNKDRQDPSDTVLFHAQKKGLITYKKLKPQMRKLFLTTPLFFTCRRKKGIELLLQGFFELNNLPTDLIDHVWYWPTPTRCNPKARSELWRKEMDEHLTAIANDKRGIK